MASLPISQFLTSALQAFDSTFEVRSGTGFEHLFFKPLQFIIQPLRDELNDIFIGQSFSRILSTTDPNSFPEDKVDAIASNSYVYRRQGSYSSGSARVYYNTPMALEYPTGGAVASGSNGLTYSNPAPFSITASQMSIQIENGLYYVDVPVQSNDTGLNTVLEPDNLVSWLNDVNYVTVTNQGPIDGGLDHELNIDFINRATNSIGVRDMVAEKGFSAILFSNFNATLLEVQPIGFQDKEMMRDIVYNTHIGGRVDGFVKTGSIVQGAANFTGVLADLTRQAFTSTNLKLAGLTATPIGSANIDRSGGNLPTVSQIKVATPAIYTSSVNLSTTVNLSGAQYISITDTGVTHTIRIVGATPAATARTEIINLINAVFGYPLVQISGNSISLTSSTPGLASSLTIADPVSGTSAITAVFGLSSGTHTYVGSGPIIFLEGIHYNFSDVNGTLQRVVGTSILTTQVNGIATNPFFTVSPVYAVSGAIYANNSKQFSIVSNIAGGTTLTVAATGVPAANGFLALVTGSPGSNAAAIPFSSYTPSSIFTDSSSNVFLNVLVNDILTVETGPDAGDYRIIRRIDNNTLVVDATFLGSNGAVSYHINRTGIKNGELVYVRYYYNPVSIDIGNQVVLDTNTGRRGIRPGRAALTITDLPILRINLIEVIDPITLEATGQVLENNAGFGRGGFGMGGFGVGNGADFTVIVNSPAERFSMFEDSFIAISPALQGLSFRVHYDYAPDIATYHDFVRSESGRVLDGDILMRHFLPAYVSGTINYTITNPDSTVPTNGALMAAVQNFISTIPSGQDIDISKIIQFMTLQLDPADKYNVTIQEPVLLTAVIQNTDGSTTVISSASVLTVPAPSPFPRATTKPLSPRITHWVADNIVLVRT